MDKVMLPVVIFLENFIVYGLVQQYAGATLDSLLEREKDDFLEISDAQIFSARSSQELYSLSHLEVNKARVVMIFKQDEIISQSR